MKTIPLTRGKEALVDDCDYEYLMQWKWRYAWRGGPEYAMCSRMFEGRRDEVYMHRLVSQRAGLKTEGKHIDHADGNGLNNCRSNLRAATPSENGANRCATRRNKSGFKGVYWKPQLRKWEASVRVMGEDHHVKCCDDPRDAARAYNEAALKHFGEFAWLNPV